MKRVVITGLGAITPLGNNVEEFWKGIKEGKCGIDYIKSFDTTDFKVKLAAEVKDYNPEDYFDKREAKRLDKFSQYAMIATREAWKDSKLDKEKENMERVGVVVGSGIGGIETIERENKKCNEKGPDRVSPMYIPMGIINMATGNVAIDIGAKGESFAMVTACATGTHCIGEGFRMIKHGYQDIVIAGGTEAGITPLSIANGRRCRSCNFRGIRTCKEKRCKNICRSSRIWSIFRFISHYFTSTRWRRWSKSHETSYGRRKGKTRRNNIYKRTWNFDTFK